MNTSLKTVVGLALVVVLSAGLAMAGRGGGGGGHGGGGHGGGGGGFHGGGGGGGFHGGGGFQGGGGRRRIPHAFFQHPASELQRTPRQSFNSRVSPRRQRFGRRPQNLGANRAFTPGSRPGTGSGLELPTRPIGTTALTPGIVRTSTIVRILGTGPTSRTVRTSATTSTSTTDEQLRPADAWRLEPRRLVSRGLARQLEQLLVLSAGGLVGGRRLGR